VAEWLEMLTSVSKVLGSIPGEVTKVLLECRRLVISITYVWVTLSTGTMRAAYRNVLAKLKGVVTFMAYCSKTNFL
jgi:hypothetical protein